MFAAQSRFREIDEIDRAFDHFAFGIGISELESPYAFEPPSLDGELRLRHSVVGSRQSAVGNSGRAQAMTCFSFT